MWALARFCAPWASNAGEKEKNALPKGRKALGLRGFGTTGRGWQAAKAFFSFSPGNCLRCKKRAKAHTPRRPVIPGFLIDVPPMPSREGGACRGTALPCPLHAGRDGPPTCAQGRRPAVCGASVLSVHRLESLCHLRGRDRLESQRL